MGASTSRTEARSPVTTIGRLVAWGPHGGRHGDEVAKAITAMRVGLFRALP